jgi:hypothetical protein
MWAFAQAALAYLLLYLWKLSAPTRALPPVLPAPPPFKEFYVCLEAVQPFSTN